MISTAAYKFDCFLAHEWGTEETKFSTHNTVKNIAVRLQGQKLSVWLDEFNLKDDVAREIVSGLRHSRKVVVFVTKRYIERVDNVNTNASKEFYCAVSKGRENVVVVLLEQCVKDRNTWFGFFKYHLGSASLIAFSTSVAVNKNFEKFCQAIRK